MARPIEYDKEAVLSNAMQLFWKKGYESTSMKDLVEVTGLTTRSMYNLFGSKNGLFEACLNWYYEFGIRAKYERLIREDGLDAIRNFFESLASKVSANGCMYVSAASDRINVDDDSINIVDKYFEDLETIFRSKLEYALRYENYECDPELRAKQLIIIINGRSVYAKNMKNLDDNKRIVDGFLKLLNI